MDVNTHEWAYVGAESVTVNHYWLARHDSPHCNHERLTVEVWTVDFLKTVSQEQNYHPLFHALYLYICWPDAFLQAEQQCQYCLPVNGNLSHITGFIRHIQIWKEIMHKTVREGTVIGLVGILISDWFGQSGGEGGARLAHRKTSHTVGHEAATKVWMGRKTHLKQSQQCYQPKQLIQGQLFWLLHQWMLTLRHSCSYIIHILYVRMCTNGSEIVTAVCGIYIFLWNGEF